MNDSALLMFYVGDNELLTFQIHEKKKEEEEKIIKALCTHFFFRHTHTHILYPK